MSNAEKLALFQEALKVIARQPPSGNRINENREFKISRKHLEKKGERDERNKPE